MKQELRTMAEKQNQDPNEMMENGLTRAENEKRQQSDESFSGVVSIIVMGISLWAMYQAIVGLSM